MKKTALCLLLALGALAGCEREDPNSPPALRKALFKQMLHESEQLGGMLRGRIAFDASAFAGGAAKLAALSTQPWQHFPQPEEGKASGNARGEVWQQQARFKQLAEGLETASAALRLASEAQPLTADTVRAPMQQVENTCKACHKEFRRF